MAKHEMDPSKLVVNDVDLSGHAALGPATGGPVAPGVMYAVGEAGCSLPNWGECQAGLKESQITIAGLKDFSYAVTFDGPLGEEEFAELAQRFESGRGDYRWSHVAPITPVKYETPDGKWQSFKHRLKWRWPRLFRRLKVRYVTYSFDAELEYDGLFSVTGTAVGPMSKGTETR